jgi:transglutaminase/protease-like cytokinesis protein 3
MKKIFLLFIVLSMLLTACSKNIPDVNESNATKTGETTVKLDDTPASTTPVEPSNTPVGTTKPETPDPGENNTKEQNKEQVEKTIYKPVKLQDISDKFAETIPLLERSLLFDVSAMNLQESKVKQTILNAYFNVINQSPTLKYAYSVEIEYDNNTAVAKCSIKYMPYKTGDVNTNNLPAGTYKVNNLKDLVAAAQNTMGKKNAPIAILNPALDVDTMQRALMQAGYGYIVYSLNDDATEIIAMPTVGRTMEQCISYINETNTLADEIISKVIFNSMTSDEKIIEIYRYVTEHVSYDQRYYTDKKAMPIESTTAYGALKDNLAICGGYSWAFNVLLSKAGIECYNISGSASREYHMWNIARYNGGFYYFDCTYDRGKSKDYNYFAKTAEDFSKNHSWDKESVDALVEGSQGK